MKNIQLTLINPFLSMLILLVFATGCEKNDYNIEDIEKYFSEDTYTDPRDSNVYKMVKIGSQTWMAENLRYLPSVVGPTKESNRTPYYYVYDYDGTNVDAAKASINYGIYGVLYNWRAAMKACPPGWHLPSNSEWKELTDFLGGESVAGSKLKETGTSHWDLWGFNDGTNESGFTGLPGGERRENSYWNNWYNFQSIGGAAFWWSSTKKNYMPNAYCIQLHDSNPMVSSGMYPSLEHGFSVRCIRD